MKKEFLVWPHNRSCRVVETILMPMLFVFILSGCAEAKSNNPLKMPPDCSANKACAVSALGKTGLLCKLDAAIPEGSVTFSVREFWATQETDNSLLWRGSEEVCGNMEQDIPPKGLTEKQENNILLGCQAVNLL
jgi:hypothetical protein